MRHNVLDALYVSISCHKVNYALDTDIKGYFDSILHSELLSLITFRIGDPGILKLIKKWLKCGVLENELVSHSDTGAVIGSIVANHFSSLLTR